MADKELYQLARGGGEIDRLNSQSDWSLALAHGMILHPSIPLREISTIADVATGTGIWITTLASHLKGKSKQHGGRKHTFVGFDVSDAQFPTNEHWEKEDGAERGERPEFVVHDMTRPFPSEYHQAFDLVHIRLVVVAVKTKDLPKVLRNVAEILRPGGYLQWEEAEQPNIWTHPFNSVAQSVLLRIDQEKLTSGLSISFANDILKELLSFTVPTPPSSAAIEDPHTHRRLNLVTRTDKMYRVLAYETFHTSSHPSANVRDVGHANLAQVWSFILRKSAESKRVEATEGELSDEAREILHREAEENEQLAASLDEEVKASAFQWQWGMTWIVAQKARFVDEKGDWMNAGHVGMFTEPSDVTA